MGKRTFWLYLAGIIGGALLFGTLVNEFIPRDWILNAMPDIHGHGAHHENNLLKMISGIILLLLILNGYIQKYLGKRTSKEEANTFNEMKAIQVYTVEGMTCNHCKAAVENGIREIDEKGDIFANPDGNELRIAGGTASESELKAKVESLGYIFKGRKQL